MCKTSVNAKKAKILSFLTLENSNIQKKASMPDLVLSQQRMINKTREVCKSLLRLDQ